MILLIVLQIGIDPTRNDITGHAPDTGKTCHVTRGNGIRDVVDVLITNYPFHEYLTTSHVKLSPPLEMPTGDENRQIGDKPSPTLLEKSK